MQTALGSTPARTPYLGDQELTALTPASLAQWWANLDATSGARKNAYETMRALLNAAAADDRTFLESSPLRIKGGAREARIISKFLYTPGQVAALADAMPEPYRALVAMLADAGLRINEALGLTRASILEREDGGMSVRVEASRIASAGIWRPGQRRQPRVCGPWPS